MVSSHGFSFKNDSAISVKNDDRTLQWLLDFDWLLYIMSVFFDLFSPQILARKMPAMPEKVIIYLFQACMHQKCATQAIHINESLYLSVFSFNLSVQRSKRPVFGWNNNPILDKLSEIV